MVGVVVPITVALIFRYQYKDSTDAFPGHN